MIATLVLITVITVAVALRMTRRPAPRPDEDYPVTLLLPVQRHPDLTRALYHASKPKPY